MSSCCKTVMCHQNLIAYFTVDCVTARFYNCKIKYEIRIFANLVYSIKNIQEMYLLCNLCLTKMQFPVLLCTGPQLDQAGHNWILFTLPLFHPDRFIFGWGAHFGAHLPRIMKVRFQQPLMTANIR